MALPCLVVTVLAFGIIAGELLEFEPLLVERPRNAAEAAVRVDAADVRRFEILGMDPNRLYEIRSGYSDDHVLAATPMEAAVLSRQVYLFRVVERAAPQLDPDTRRHLACLAQDVRASDIVEHLAESGTPPLCEDGTTIAMLRKRK